jgi:hypothetical protein
MSQASSSNKAALKQVCCMFGLFFDPEVGGSTLLKNIGELLPE